LVAHGCKVLLKNILRIVIIGDDHDGAVFMSIEERVLKHGRGESLRSGGERLELQYSDRASQNLSQTATDLCVHAHRNPRDEDSPVPPKAFGLSWLRFGHDDLDHPIRRISRARHLH
jgi:hypothetical protein